MYLDFLNKNTLRKYPIKGSCTGRSVAGETLPTELITAISLTNNNGNELYFSKIVGKKDYLNIVLSDVSTGINIGSFSARITQDYQVINLSSNNSFTSGTLTIGLKSALDRVQGVYNFDPVDTTIEPSTITVYTPPTVYRLKKGNKEAYGKINITGVNANINAGEGNIVINTVDKSKILVNNYFKGRYDNCNLPTIVKINTVLPDNNGNIDIYSILPITIEVAGEGTIGTDPNLELEQVCPALNKVFAPNDSSDTYYADILTVTIPEWQTWEDFD